MNGAREEANRRWPKGWDVEEGTWRDGAVNGFILGAEWASNRGTALNVERENAAAEYRKATGWGDSQGEAVHEAFISGAEWERDFKVERA